MQKVRVVTGFSLGGGQDVYPGDILDVPGDMSEADAKRRIASGSLTNHPDAPAVPVVPQTFKATGDFTTRKGVAVHADDTLTVPDDITAFEANSRASAGLLVSTTPPVPPSRIKATADFARDGGRVVHKGDVIDVGIDMPQVEADRHVAAGNAAFEELPKAKAEGVSPHRKPDEDDGEITHRDPAARHRDPTHKR